MSAGVGPVMATQIFPIRERMKWVEATAGPSRAGAPLIGVGRGAGTGGETGVELPFAGTLAIFEPSDFGPLSRGGAARATAVEDFIPAIAAS